MEVQYRMVTVDIDLKTKFIRGFADKTRLLILECIKDKEKTVSEIVEEINGNQSNVSQHLACLKGCGIIVGRQQGKYMYYQLRNNQMKQLLNMFDEVLSIVEQDIEQCEINPARISDKG